MASAAGAFKVPGVSEDTIHSRGIPASTLVVFRKQCAGGPPEILMVVRSRALKFAGGMAVFPGGRIDPADHALARQVASALPEDEAAARIAAIRETPEETGLALGLTGDVTARTAAEARAVLLEREELAPVLGRFGWTLDLETLVPFARWLPHELPHSRVFDTRFYLANLGTGAVEIAVDRTENTRMFWTSAQGALDMADRGEIQIIFPTRRNLERLAQFPDFAAARNQARTIPVRTIIPQIVEIESERWLHIPEDAGYPVTGEKLDSAKRG